MSSPSALESQPAARPGLDLRSIESQVYSELRSRILRRELPPGARLSLGNLAQLMGVSVTPVRDALRRLSAEGLVAIQPRVGTIVTPISAVDIHDLYQVRMMIEPNAAELAVVTLTDEELQRLAHLVDLLEAPPSESDGLDTYMNDLANDSAFHTLVVSALRNQRLDKLYATIHASVIVARAIFPVRYHDVNHRVGEHRLILEALIARNGKLARRAAEEHLRDAENDAVARMAAT